MPKPKAVVAGLSLHAPAARTPLDTGAVGLLGAAPDGTVLLMSDDRGLVGLRP